NLQLCPPWRRLLRFAGQRRQYRSDFAPTLFLSRLHVLHQLLGQLVLQLRTARVITQLPCHSRDRARDLLHFLVVDLVRRIGRTVIVHVQAGGEERDRNSQFGEVV